MSHTSNTVKVFFEGVEKASNSIDLDLVATQYEDTFLFANPDGARAIEKQKFLAVLPKRYEFFKSMGHRSTQVLSLEETPIDREYTMVRAYFLMSFEKETMPLMEIKVDSVYILHIKDNSVKIVMHIEHEDLQKAMQARGLLPVDQ